MDKLTTLAILYTIYFILVPFFKGRRNGTGTCQFFNGDIYKGEWNKDDMEGKGCYSWKDTSSVYVGEWLKRNRHGNGVYLMFNNPNKSEEKKKDRKCALFSLTCGEWKNDHLIKCIKVC